tara:strand:+ start:79 stop:744 length:666 start_codon:yes stop_codon:yes gene_type:complete
VTFSLLAYEPEEGTFYGASATGNLCVGGWVLRGDSRVGLTASQGADPSTLWGEDILKLMIEGYQPEDALNKITQADKGRENRQVAVIGNRGEGAVFSGMNNLPIVDSIVEDNLALSGNILQSNKVLSKMREAYFEESKCELQKLWEVLNAGASAGGDVRGLMSASILVLNDRKPPISLRVDYSDDPLRDLSKLIQKIKDEKYQNWLKELPTRHNPYNSSGK